MISVSDAGSEMPPAAQAQDLAAALACWLARYRLWVFAGVAAAYGLSFSGNWQWAKDDQHHIIMAQRFLAGLGMTHPWGYEHHVQPGLSWLIVAGFKLFGDTSFLGPQLLMLAISVTTLAVTYVWAKRVLGVGPAVAVVVLLAVNETFFRFSYQLLTEMPFVLGAMLLLLGVERVRDRRADVVGLVLLIVGLGVMAAFRSVCVIYILAFVLVGGIIVVRWKWRWSLAVGLIGLVLAVAAMIVVPMLPIREESDWGIIVRELGQPMTTLGRMFRTNLPLMLTESMGEAVFAVDFGPIACTALSVVVMAILLSLYRVRLYWGALATGFMLQWLVFWMDDRYMLPLLPLVAVGWWMLAAYATGRCRPAAGRVVLVGMLVLWVVPNAIKSGEFAWQANNREPKIKDVADFAKHPDARYRLAYQLRGQWGDAGGDGAVIWTDLDEPAQLMVVARRAFVTGPRVGKTEQMNVSPILALVLDSNKPDGGELIQHEGNAGLWRLPVRGR